MFGTLLLNLIGIIFLYLITLFIFWCPKEKFLNFVLLGGFFLVIFTLGFTFQSHFITGFLCILLTLFVVFYILSLQLKSIFILSGGFALISLLFLLAKWSTLGNIFASLIYFSLLVALLKVFLYGKETTE